MEIQRPPLIDRSVLFLIFVLLFFGILLFQLFYLQVIAGKKHFELSQNNRLRILPEEAPRGVIYDRKGAVLATNLPSLRVTLIPNKFKTARDRLETVAAQLDLPSEKVLFKIEEAGWDSPYPITLLREPDARQISYFSENPFPGVQIESDLARHYPYNELAVHTLGYVGEVTPENIKKDRDLKPGELIGKSGLEKLFEKELRGIKGGKAVEVDSRGEDLRVIREIEPLPGRSLTLTLDLELQQVAEEALGNLRGGVIAMNPNTGEILVLVSHPSYDPNLFLKSLSQREWEKLMTLKAPFMNRVLSAYPPGSTFKPIVALAALEEGKTNPGETFLSTGSMKIGNRIFGDWKKGGFGVVNLERALAYSVDTVFYELGLRLGPEKIHDYAEQFGLGKPTGFMLPESEGLNPDPQWKSKAIKARWMGGDTANFAIGQGDLTATPLQMALAVSALANGGTLYTPLLVKEISPSRNEKTRVFPPAPRKKINLNPEQLEQVKKGMRAAVAYGTAAAVRFNSLEVAGKTGSAEVAHSKKPHAWFVSFAPYKNPSLVVVVFAEEAGHGGDVCAPIARKIYEKAFSLSEGGTSAGESD